MTAYKPQVGDRVRVVLEGEVSATGTGWFNLGGYVLDGKSATSIWPTRERTVSVEKIAPPVEVFGPGDVVRSKREGSYWQILDDGYVRLGTFEPGRSYAAVCSVGSRFTSADFERVSLGGDS